MADIHQYYPDTYYPLEEPRERRSVDKFFQRFSDRLKEGIREEFYGYPSRTGRKRSTAARFFRKVLLYPEYVHLRFAGRDILPFHGEGRLLDVGCGPGKLLRVLRDWGWDTYGVDFSPVAVEYARKKHNLKVDLGTIHDAKYPANHFDVVMFNHCLEHVYDPIESLMEAHRILKPGGVLQITIPNADSFEAHVFGKWWVQWDVPRHLHHFTRTTMSRTLVKTGFQPVTIGTGTGTAFMLGSIDYVYKHVLGWKRRVGKLIKHLVARPLCIVMGHLGRGSEMKVLAEKPLA